MAISILDDKSVTPSTEGLKVVLKDTFSLWEKLVNQVKTEYPEVTEEWKHYGKAAGWTCKLLSKKRNLLFLVPLDGCFLVRLVLSEKAVADTARFDLPKEIITAIAKATVYAEGRSIDININHPEQLPTINTLLKIKYES